MAFWLSHSAAACGVYCKYLSCIFGNASGAVCMDDPVYYPGHYVQSHYPNTFKKGDMADN